MTTVRIAVGRLFLHVGWKLIGVHVSPGIIVTPNGKEIRL